MYKRQQHLYPHFTFKYFFSYGDVCAPFKRSRHSYDKPFASFSDEMDFLTGLYCSVNLTQTIWDTWVFLNKLNLVSQSQRWTIIVNTAYLTLFLWSLYHVLLYVFFSYLDSLGSSDSKAGTFPRRHNTIAWSKSDFADGMLKLNGWNLLRHQSPFHKK
jgi:hypothetical protein